MSVMDLISISLQRMDTWHFSLIDQHLWSYGPPDVTKSRFILNLNLSCASRKTKLISLVWDANISTNASPWRRAVVAQICFHRNGLTPLLFAHCHMLQSLLGSSLQELTLLHKTEDGRDQKMCKEASWPLSHSCFKCCHSCCSSVSYQFTVLLINAIKRGGKLNQNFHAFHAKVFVKQ